MQRNRYRHASRWTGLLGVLALCTVMSSCAVIQRQTSPTPAGPATQLPEKIWIFEASRTQSTIDRLGRCSGLPFGTVTGAWTPDSHLVRRLDPTIRRAVNAVGVVAIMGSDYHLQYFGIIVEGDRLLYINGIHQVLVTSMLRKPEQELADAPVVVCDAGRGAFQTEYNLLTGQLGRIRFESSYGGRLPGS